jgi:hypothetical protein
MRIAIFKIPRAISNIVRLWAFVFTPFPRAVSVLEELIMDKARDCNSVIRFKSEVGGCCAPV